MRRIMIAALLALAACLPAGPPVAERPATPDTCGIAERSAFVGQPVSAIVTAGLAGGARIIRPGDAVTEDYSAARLNIDLDSSDVVTRLWCG